MVEFLGTRGEEFKYKLYYFVWIIFLFLFMFWSWIGNIRAREMIQFYIWFGLFALFFILFDNATRKHFEEIDTVTIEEPRFSFLGPKVSFAIAIIMSVILTYNIFTTKQAWANYPKFQLFDSKYLNALLSGILGVVENLVFFSFCFPTAYAIIHKKTQNSIISFLFSLAIISLLFSLFHIFVYGTQPTALFSTVIFAIICCSTVFLFHNMIIADALHLTNNFVAFLINAGVGLVIRL